MSAPQLTIQFLGGVIFVLSAYVIIEHLRYWRKGGMRLLPLHVWLVTVSYNFLVLSLMFRIPRSDTAFIFGSSGLCIGIFSLAVLSRAQWRRDHNRS